MTPLLSCERAPFRHGHMRRRHACVTCGRPTRRTALLPGRSWGRYVLCSGCELPGPEARLLMAIYGVETMPELQAARRRRWSFVAAQIRPVRSVVLVDGDDVITPRRRDAGETDER